MLNRYDNGNVYIGSHSDNLDNHVILTLSLGANRKFIFRSRSNPKLKHEMEIENGSVMVMQGVTQLFWKHEIPKEPKVKQGRISLTFRQVVQ